MKCKHCKCHQELLKKLRKGAEITNAKLTTEQRRKNALKGLKKKR